MRKLVMSGKLPSMRGASRREIVDYGNVKRGLWLGKKL